MNYFKVDGKSYDGLVTEIEETWNILYSDNTGRSLNPGARMVLDPLGTFYGHKVTVARKQGHEKEYDELYDYIAKPRYNGVMLEAAHNQKTITYEAYASNGGRPLNTITKKNVVKWGRFVINFVPMEAQVLPE